YTKSRIHFALELSLLARVFEDRYQDLAGTLLEGIARLFTQNVRVIVYPTAVENLQRLKAAGRIAEWNWKEENGKVNAANFHPSGHLDSLYQYLLTSEFIIPSKRPSP